MRAMPAGGLARFTRVPCTVRPDGQGDEGAACAYGAAARRAGSICAVPAPAPARYAVLPAVHPGGSDVASDGAACTYGTTASLHRKAGSASAAPACTYGTATSLHRKAGSVCAAPASGYLHTHDVTLAGFPGSGQLSM